MPFFNPGQNTEYVLEVELAQWREAFEKIGVKVSRATI